MSIVYDYLKQINYKTEPSTGAAPVPSNSRSTVWIKISLVVGVCLLVGLGVYLFGPRVVKPVIEHYYARVTNVSDDVPVMRSTEDSYVLEGIIYNPSRPFAIINGKMLEKEGVIGDFKVAQIAPDTVELKNLKDGTSRTIRL